MPLKRQVGWFNGLSQKSSDTLNVEQLEQLNDFKERYPVFKANRSITFCITLDKIVDVERL